MLTFFYINIGFIVMKVPSRKDQLSPIESPLVSHIITVIMPLCIVPYVYESSMTNKEVCDMSYKEAEIILRRKHKLQRKPKCHHSRALFIAWAWIVKNTESIHERHEKELMAILGRAVHELLVFQLKLDSMLLKPKS